MCLVSLIRGSLISVRWVDVMVWDETKFPGDTVFSADWNAMVSDQKAYTIRVVNALPPSGIEGRVVYLTTDDHLYLDDGL